jgi:hypothetical protein
MRPGLRRLNLVVHVGSSVGWLGAVAAFLALSIVGRTSADAGSVRAVYVAMNLIGLYVMVPLSLAALVSGVVQSLITHWGLARHYWVLAKLALTVGATLLLVLHQFTAVAAAAERALGGAPAQLPDIGRLGKQLVFDAAFAAVVLVITTTLSVFKPWGRTRFGSLAAVNTTVPGAGTVRGRSPIGVRILIVALGAILATIVVLHLAGGGMHGHGM